jgi:hypothetical protein
MLIFVMPLVKTRLLLFDVNPGALIAPFVAQLVSSSQNAISALLKAVPL